MKTVNSAEGRYISPETNYVDLFNEGVLCSSLDLSIEDVEEVDWGELFSE